MLKELEKKEKWLKEFATNNSLSSLTSEDIIKLLLAPYLTEEIAKAYNISVKEFNEIRKKKGIQNIYLENTIRNIETILNDIDSNNIFISDKIKKEIINELAKILLTSVPKKDYYIKKILEIDFNNNKVKDNILRKNIDIEYRMKQLEDVVLYINNKIKKLKEEERNCFYNYNDQKLYNQLLKEKQEGKILKKENLTYEVLYELSIIENIADSVVGELYNLNKNQIKYLRNKYNLSNKFNTKIKDHPETLMYYLEEKNMRNKNISNDKYKEMIETFIENNYTNKKSANDNEYYDITIDVNGEENIYHVHFSSEKYKTNSKNNNRKNNGSHHNYKNENETKIAHGKIGEQIALKAEKLRLEELGLKELVKDIKLVAQINDEITFDGIGYDLISFNKYKEPICIEVKTSYGKKDKPFFISKKELNILKGLYEEYNCKECIIYYVLVNNSNVTIKTINIDDFNRLELTPILFEVR